MVLTRLVRWLTFTVLVALLPLVCLWLRDVQHGTPAGLVDVAGNGDLYVVAGGLCAGAVGELVGRPNARRHVVHLLAVAGAMAVVLVSAFLFADARGHANGVNAQGRPDPERVTEMSTWVLAVAVSVGGACVGLAER